MSYWEIFKITFLFTLSLVSFVGGVAFFMERAALARTAGPAFGWSVAAMVMFVAGVSGVVYLGAKS